ncbi:hypothetical protein P3S68_014190 [Capsicum galapagoense]
MEYLSRNLNRLKEDKTFRFRPRCSKLGITQLSFADDLLLVARGDILFVTALHKCFLKFSQASRLLANLIKSLVYFGGIAPMESSRILQHLGFAHGELPFKYLGIPLSARKITLVQWSYFWSGTNVVNKKALVAWSKVCSPKVSGGLDLTNLSVWNNVAVSTKCWDLANNKDRLWIK